MSLPTTRTPQHFLSSWRVRPSFRVGATSMYCNCFLYGSVIKAVVSLNNDMPQGRLVKSIVSCRVNDLSNNFRFLLRLSLRISLPSDIKTHPVIPGAPQSDDIFIFFWLRFSTFMSVNTLFRLSFGYNSVFNKCSNVLYFYQHVH